MPAPRPRRRRSARPYRRELSFQRAVAYLNRRAIRLGSQLHGARCLKTLVGLNRYQARHRHGVLFVGTQQLGLEGGQSRRSVQRSLPELVELGAILLDRTQGGKTLDENGQPVACANGYQLNPEVQVAEAPPACRLPRDPADTPGPWSAPRGGRYLSPSAAAP